MLYANTYVYMHTYVKILKPHMKKPMNALLTFLYSLVFFLFLNYNFTSRPLAELRSLKGAKLLYFFDPVCPLGLLGRLPVRGTIKGRVHIQ